LLICAVCYIESRERERVSVNEKDSNKCVSLLCLWLSLEGPRGLESISAHYDWVVILWNLCHFMCFMRIHVIHVIVCHFISFYVILCQFMSDNVSSCQFMLIHVNSCQFMSFHVIHVDVFKFMLLNSIHIIHVNS
jgi:hypothetical protein